MPWVSSKWTRQVICLPLDGSVICISVNEAFLSRAMEVGNIEPNRDQRSMGQLWTVTASDKSQLKHFLLIYLLSGANSVAKTQWILICRLIQREGLRPIIKLFNVSCFSRRMAVDDNVKWPISVQSECQ